MAIELVNFVSSNKTYNKPGTILRQKETIGYHFVNTGDVIVFINGLPLHPSGVWDTMYPGYRDVSLYTIRFDNSILPVVNPELTVIMYSQA